MAAKHQRARDKLRKEERQDRLLAYRLDLDVYPATAGRLTHIMAMCDLEGSQDVITRLVQKCGSP